MCVCFVGDVDRSVRLTNEEMEVVMGTNDMCVRGTRKSEKKGERHDRFCFCRLVAVVSSML